MAKRASSPSEAEALARAKWRSSGLTDEQAKRLGFEAWQPGDVTAALPQSPPVPGLAIPYYDPLGKPTGFFRVRYLGAPPGFKVEKPQRYAQPAGSVNQVYLPPLLKEPWAKVMAESAVPLLITEGELKAACASAHGLPTMGLGGVDVWRSSRKGLSMLPELEATDWNRREVTIVYDSDAATNANVVRAQHQLAKELTNRGALVRVASLPPADKGAKQGLDDYLVQHGRAELDKVLARALMLEEALALWKMNDEAVFITDPGLVLLQKTGQRCNPQQFTNSIYANKHHKEAQRNKDGSIKFVEKPTAKRWLEWDARFTLDRITYAPGKAHIVDNQWNAWQGWGCAPQKGDMAPWHWLLDFLFKGEKEAKRWFQQWLAWPLKHPGTKLFSSAVLWGVHHGTGKTTVAYAMRRIYGDNFVEIKNENLRGGFNEWAANKQFVYGDEITGTDRRVDADKLKGLITQEQLRINQKYMPSYVVPDCVNYYFTSNHPDAFFLDDTDRRFFVHEVVGKPAPLSDYKKVDKWLNGAGPAALFHYLLHLDLEGFDPKGPALVTRAKREMIVDSKSDLGTWCLGLKEDPDRVLAPLGTGHVKGCELYTPTQLHRAYDPQGATRVTVNGLSRELKRLGFRQEIVTGKHGGSHRLYAVKNGDAWMHRLPKEWADHYEKHFVEKGKKYE